MPGALHLRHPATAYWRVNYRTLVDFNSVAGMASSYGKRHLNVLSSLVGAGHAREKQEMNPNTGTLQGFQSMVDIKRTVRFN